MRIKNGFMLRKLAGQSVVVPLGARVVEFNGIMTLSESGALLWQKLQDGATEDELVQEILSNYNIDENTARTDVKAFIESMSARNILEL